MKARFAVPATALAAVLGMAGCGQKAGIDDPALAYGANPALTKPDKAFLIPTVKVAEVVGWQAGEAPTAAAGLRVEAFAEGLDHPRWLYRLPNGDILLAESNAPRKTTAGPKPEAGLFEKIKNAVRKSVMSKAGAGAPSPDHILLLRDADGDGKAETRTVLLSGLRSPFGMALIGDYLYVGNTDAVDRYPFVPGQTAITARAETVVKIPGGGGHYARNIIPSADGTKLYVTVGSATNIANGGIEAEKDRAAILEVDIAARRYTVFASGLRNPNGLAWRPATGELWTTVNERDELGADLVPDYMTAVKRGAFYGWPYSYYGQHVDDRVKPQRPDLVAAAIKPDYALGAHTAALGLAFYDGRGLPARYDGGAFVALHGSWNRKPAAGYRVVFVPFQGGAPAPNVFPQDVLTGFLTAEGKARGRPVAVIQDQTGALLVTDDVGDKVWRVTAASPRPAGSAVAGPQRPPAG